MRRIDKNRCPKCRERVSPFAAGCALCGADLDISRFDRGPGPVQRAGSALSALTTGPSRRRDLTPRWQSSRFQGAVVAYFAIFCFTGVLILLLVALLAIGWLSAIL